MSFLFFVFYHVNLDHRNTLPAAWIYPFFFHITYRSQVSMGRHRCMKKAYLIRLCHMIDEIWSNYWSNFETENLIPLFHCFPWGGMAQCWWFPPPYQSTLWHQHLLKGEKNCSPMSGICYWSLTRGNIPIRSFDSSFIHQHWMSVDHLMSLIDAAKCYRKKKTSEV